jgi:hypothetical protein
MASPLKRVSLRLDEAILERLRDEAREQKVNMSQMARILLDRALGRLPAKPPRFEVQPHSFGFRPGANMDSLNRLADELEAGEAARKLGP